MPDTTTFDLRDEMPVLARHEGEWKGHYIDIDPEGEVIDTFEARLSCRFPEDGEYDYHQINRYEWPDGRKEVHEFPAVYENGQIWFDTDRIEGHAWEADERTVVLTWTRKDLPGVYFYEMIHINEDNDRRSRTWHWFKDDELVKRTIIDEHRIDDA
jgi:hypothetical protein